MSAEQLTLENLTVLNLIACGSFGKVYLVKDQAGTIYAMKQLSKQKIIMMRQVDHVRQEIEILRQVKSNYIAKMYSCFQDDKYVYMVFEFIPGGELFFHLRRYEQFPVEVARFYLAEISTALGYCHDQLGVLYRDLKPENVLLDKKGHVKLTDFGFAKQCRELTFTPLGTPEYMAPELIRQTGHHKSADWWSFGILAYELLCGHAPFMHDDLNVLYQKILKGQFVFPPNIDPDAQDLITKLLNTDRDKRFGANVQTGTKDIKAHPFFNGVNWNWIEKKLVKPPIVPEIKSGEDLDFWKNAAEEFVADEDEIQEMVEQGGFGEIPADGGKALFAWV
ncbi:Kinase [Hexamita inflata]|uniref:AGC PKA n=1 Tax=Hexamita inflata TaxID=28002 RepID=A0AA86TRE2_9EUKA|nr:AGC PKA [Hexamita inflata]